MGSWQQVLLGVGGGLLIVWLAMLAMFLVVARGQDPVGMREALRLVPDMIRLLRRLHADRTLPRGLRLRLWLLLGYLLLPVDLIPDFIPVVGYADDAIVVALALRAVIRAAGPAAVARHWSGTPAGLTTLYRLARLPHSDIDADAHTDADADADRAVPEPPDSPSPDADRPGRRG